MSLNTPERAAGSCWLIFADTDGIGDALAAAVGPLGVKAVLVKRGDAFSIEDDGAFCIRASEKDDYITLLKELKRGSRIPSRIVHLWAAEHWEEPPGDRLQQRLDASFYSLFYLAQAIGDRLSEVPIELCIVSSDLEPVLGVEDLHPAKATLRGPCKVIRQEYANVACRSIDLYCGSEQATADQLARQLAAELLSGREDQFVAFREGKRWLPTLEHVRVEAPLEAVPRLKEGGVYLITGGLGGIGFAFAQYLYEKYNAKLVLVGRSALPPREQWEQIAAQSQEDRTTERVRKLQDLIQAGADLLLITADVTDQSQMDAAVRQAIERFGRIDGVLHAAGLPGQGLTQLKTAQTAAAAMAPKIQGTLVLDRALAGLDLDFMILVSSIAVFTGGGPGQIDYCAANAFLDAFAHHRRGAHGLTVAINFGEWQWDAWSEGLKGFQPEIREAYMQHRRQFGITFEEGMEAIRRVLSLDLAQIIVLPEDAVAMVAGSNACSVTHLTQVVRQDRARRQSSYPRPALSTSFVAAGNELERKIAAVWQQVLGIEKIGIKDNFFDLGGNSLVGLQVIAELRKALEVELTPIVLYEAPTIEAQVRYLSPEPELTDQTQRVRLTERRERVRAEHRSHDIALIGMAGRFPGARTPQELWKNLAAGVESVTFYSEAELLEAGVSQSLLRNANYVRAGYDVEGFDLFDAGLFGYSPREAEFIDPQHRQFLECAWEALEDAGCDPQTYEGKIGVFGGANSSAYSHNLRSRPELLSSGVATFRLVLATTTTP